MLSQQRQAGVLESIEPPSLAPIEHYCQKLWLNHGKIPARSGARRSSAPVLPWSGEGAREGGTARLFAIKARVLPHLRFEQGADVVRGAGTGPERLQKFTFKATGEKLSPLFDGTEQLINMTSVPWYQREIYLPGS
jgi:hypothetical protein